MSKVGGKHEYCLNLGVSESYVIVGDDLLDLGELFLESLSLLDDKVASVFDSYVFKLCESGKVSVVSYSSATNDCNNSSFHNFFLPFVLINFK